MALFGSSPLALNLVAFLDLASSFSRSAILALRVSTSAEDVDADPAVAVPEGLLTDDDAAAAAAVVLRTKTM